MSDKDFIDDEAGRNALAGRGTSIEEIEGQLEKNLLQSVRDAAYGRRATRTTKREFDKDGKLVKETVTEIPYAPDKEALKWLQERGLEEKPDGDP